MKRGQTDIIGIILILVIAVGGVFLLKGGDIGLQATDGEGWTLPIFNFKFPEFNVIINTDGSTSDDSALDSDSQGQQTTPPPPPPPDTLPQNFKVPTSLTVVVEPPSLDTGDWFYAQVISNGYNSEVTVYASHRGSGQEVSFEGWIGEDGKFYHAQSIDIAGVWDFWATADNGAVISNTMTITVQGLQIFPTLSHMSMSGGDGTQVVHLYSHMSGDVLVVMHNPAMGISIPLSDAQIHVGGYGDIIIDVSGNPAGDYELDIIHDNGHTASGWDGTSWISIGR